MPGFAGVGGWRSLGLAGHLELSFRGERTCLGHRPASGARCLSSGQKREDFLGTGDFIFVLGFGFGGVLQFLVSKR